MNRATMFANIDKVLKLAKGERADSAAGQVDLFGGTTEEDLSLVELPEWSLERRLWGERKTLGTFITGHPLDPYEPQYRDRITHKLNELDTLVLTDWPVQRPITVAALVVAVYENGFNTGVVLSDQTGRTEIKFYRDEYERSRWILRPDFLVVLQCRLKRDGKWSGVNGQKGYKLGEFSPPD